MSDYKTETCRSCPAVIVWAVTERGKAMPVDAVPCAAGNVALVAREGRAPLAKVLGVAARFGRTDLHTSHFVTCPNASQHRRRSTS